jgi:homoserine kinase type II
MALYTLLNFEDIVQLTGRFGITPCSSHPLAGGVENTSYAVTARQGDFVLTILEKRDLASAELYSRYLRSLMANRIPVPRALACGNNRYVTEFAGKPVILLEYIRGAQHDPLPAEYLSGVGATLAKLHISAVDCPLKPYIRFCEDDLAVASTFKDEIFGAWLIRWYQEVAEVVASDYACVATHGDPFPDNVIVAGDGQIFLIDWEDGARDSFLVDLGMAVLGLCCVNGFDPARLNCLLAGYRSLNAAQFRSHDLLRWTIYVALFTAYNRYRKQGASVPVVQDKRSYLNVPPLIESVVQGWGKVIA